MKFLGNPGQASGLLSEKILLPAESCFPLPGHLSNESAVLAEPLSIAIWAGDLARIRKGMSVGILGCGPIGMSVLKYCRYKGVENCYVTDLLDYRLEMAESAGAGWTGNPGREDIVEAVQGERPDGLDIVFDCCGKQEAMEEAIRILKPGGMIMIVGIPEFENWIFPTDLIRRKEIAFQNVRRQNNRLRTAIELIAGGMIETDSLITHRFGMEDAADAFGLVAAYRDKVMKAIINLDQGI
jgi:L-iditol 2-dehydrogenase